jgi:hypothetical protein
LPLSAVAAMGGVSRLALYRMLWTGRVSDDMAELLTPVGECIARPVGALSWIARRQLPECRECQGCSPTRH